MAAVDRELGYAGVKTYAGIATGAASSSASSAPTSRELVALIEADKLGQLRTGAASGVAARHLARPSASSLGVIGCGWQAASQIACIRAAVPTIERVVSTAATARTARRRSASAIGAEPAESPPRRGRRRHRRHGHHVDGSGAPRRVAARRRARLRGRRERSEQRELDNVVLERAAFVCCDSREQREARVGRPDRARRERRPRLARGARAAGGRRRRGARARRSGGHRPLQVERDRRLGRRGRRPRRRARARARASG